MRPDSVRDILQRIPDARGRNLARVAETVKALRGAPLEWERGGLFYALDAVPFDKQNGNRAATVFDLSVVSAGGLIFRDRVQCWDGARIMVPDGDGFREDPVEAARIDLAHTVKVVTKGGREPWVKAKPGTVSTFYAETNDAQVNSSSTSYASARSGTSSGVDTSGTWVVTEWSSGFTISQGFFAFDTSALDGLDLDDVTLSFYSALILSADGWGTFYVRAFDWGTEATFADFRPTNGTSATDTLLASIARTSLTNSQYNDLTSEAAFLGAVNKTGETRVYSVLSNAEAATEPTGNNNWWVQSANTSGTTQDPKLVVTHEAAGKPFRRSLLGVGF